MGCLSCFSLFCVVVWIITSLYLFSVSVLYFCPHLPCVLVRSRSWPGFHEYVFLLVPQELCPRRSIRLDESGCPVLEARCECKLGKDFFSSAQYVVWSVASADQCSMDNAVAHMQSTQRTGRRSWTSHLLCWWSTGTYQMYSHLGRSIFVQAYRRFHYHSL